MHTEAMETNRQRPIQLLVKTAILLSALIAQFNQIQATYLNPISSSQAAQSSETPSPPIITPFSFNQNVQENQRSSVLCTISSGELPVTISWLKDGQLLTPAVAQARKIIIKPDSDQSTLKFALVRLDHTGNYTCVAKNRAGIQAHSAQLIVHGEPRWLREPQHEPLIATRGQTIVIDCQTTGWPRPQQSWQIKTHAQSEFEPLAATGRISLAANGSLVIRNADKSDEANYLCKSSNGIGKGISWSTSLKITVPAHFESTKQLANVVRKQSHVQLRCDAYGDEPITIEWFKDKQRMTNELDARYSIHNKPLPNGLISLLVIKSSQRQDNSIYECVARNPAGKDRLPIELVVQEEPESIQELQATQINSRSVTLMWTEPYDGRSAITSYEFQFLNELDFSMDSIELAPSPADGRSLLATQRSSSADGWQQASRIVLPVGQPASSTNQTPSAIGQQTIKSITIDKLLPSSKYILRALAVNGIGQSRFSQPMEFTTEEEAPEIGPVNIRAQALNSTSIQVSWDEISKSKQFGRIQGYYIGYRLANSTSQNFVYKPYVINDSILQQQQQQQQQQSQPLAQSIESASQIPRLDTVIHDLRRDTNYEITVVAFNSRGSGPSSDIVLCKTIEMEAPKPVKLEIRRESNESIFIQWHRDPLDQNPVDDYVLYQEKNSASQQWLQMRLPGNQTQYKAPGLKCGVRYQFYIIANNKVGKSQPSEVVSASTSGALPLIPSKSQLIKMVNSTCLLVNLNSFQDNGCRIKAFTVRYRVEKVGQQQAGAPLTGSNGMVATHQALSSSSPPSSSPSAASVISGPSGSVAAKSSPAAPSSAAMQHQHHSEWVTIRPKSNAKHQRANEEDRMEYLCDLNPIGEYTIHVAANNDVGRTEIEYSVLMSSDELRHSNLRELLELLANLPQMFSYIPSVLVFLLAGLFLSAVSMFVYTTVVRYYEKFVIMQNQIRATRRAKRDEKRRRKLNNSRHSQKLDLWADEYEEEDDEGIDDEDDDDDEDDEPGTAGIDVDGDDEEGFCDDDQDCSSGQSSSRLRRHNAQLRQHQQRQFGAGHYLSNLANSTHDNCSIDGQCAKFNSAGSCMSTASTDSIHGRFQCLNSKQYVKMNEYTMLPSISATLSPPNDIYGTTSPSSAALSSATAGQVGAGQASQVGAQQSANNSLYYSTLRRSNMQTYLPQQGRQAQQHASPHQHQQQQQQLQRRQSQNMADIYGYYMAPQQAANLSASQQQQVAMQQAAAVNEAANSIFVPPQQIIYSAPNIRRQPPVFL